MNIYIYTFTCGHPTYFSPASNGHRPEVELGPICPERLGARLAHPFCLGWRQFHDHSLVTGYISYIHIYIYIYIYIHIYIILLLRSPFLLVSGETSQTCGAPTWRRSLADLIATASGDRLQRWNR